MLKIESLKKIKEILVHNWRAKALCFGISCLLYIFYQNQTLESNTLTIPLRIKADNGIVMENSPSTSNVAVEIRGRIEDLKNLSETDFRPYLDLNYTPQAGEYDFPVLLDISNRALKISPLEITVRPKQIHLSVDEKYTDFIDVKPLFVGSVPSGYELKYSVLPEQVKITGPKSRVEKLKLVQTKEIDISSISGTEVVSTRINSPGVFLKYDEKQEFKVMMELAAKKSVKSFSNIPVNFINLADNLKIENPEKYVSIRLYASSLDLENFSPSDNAVEVDCSGISGAGTFSVPLSFNFPSNFSVSKDSPENISVTFTEKKDENITEKENSPAPENAPDSENTDASENAGDIEKILEENYGAAE
ncbi:CdaR family protein [Treponema zioleckii]|uniref:CdaR family protein n=1 Tax=Treponema zioleckii TaxID=331680 RepID=UPI00168B36A8|nr:CdaR family protein [Treponema zioleckii]